MGKTVLIVEDEQNIVDILSFNLSREGYDTLEAYDGATGLKTGFTDSALYCLSATAERNGMELIAVVMGAETSQERFAACKGMLDQGFANYALYTPNIQEGASVPVTLGQADSVAAVPDKIPQFLVERAKLADVSAEISLSTQADAPIVQGQHLGMLTIRAGEEILAEVPLVAASEVPRLTWGQVTVRILRQVAMAQT